MMPEREKVQHGLECCYNNNCGACPYSAIKKCQHKLHSDALALLKEQEARWIPVTERLPKEKINPNTLDFEFVLCATVFGDVRPHKYGTPIGQGEAHFWNGSGYVDAYVTHWMDMPDPPEPPKEQEDGE